MLYATAATDEGHMASEREKYYYQAALDLRGRTCVVVGGGAVARRKVESLLRAGASVTVVAPDCLPMPAAVTTVRAPFTDDHLTGAALAVAATDDPAVNTRVARAARDRGIWVNVVDDPDAGTFIVPAVVERGAFRIAVSTGGTSPALAARVRQRLEAEFGPEYADFVEILGELRSEWEPRALAAGVPPAARRAAWHAVLDLPLADLLRDGRRAEAVASAWALLDAALSAAGVSPGGGPGSPIPRSASSEPDR